MYERFAPQDPDGRLDQARGIRQIIVGTGGGALYTPITSAPNTEAIGIVFGVLKLTLGDGGYQWQFLPIPGTSFSDSGPDSVTDGSRVQESSTGAKGSAVDLAEFESTLDANTHRR